MMKKLLYLLAIGLTIGLSQSELKAQNCQAMFQYQANGLTVQFQDSSVAPLNASYFWWFGSGSASSTSQNPTFTYPSAGTYLVNLSVSSGQNCFDSTSVYVTVRSACPISFSHTTSATNNLTVNFNGSATITSQSHIYWRFGDNNSNFTNTLNPTHTYANPGTYIVSMSYYDSLSNCNSFYTDSVTVGASSPNCIANFTVTKDSSISTGVLLINNSSLANSNTYFWDFGDNNSSTLRNPNHQYSSFGSYVVCLTVTDTFLNCVSTFCDTVGMDSLGNLKSVGFSMRVQDPISVGVEDDENDLNALIIYPNPVSDNLTIDLSSLDRSNMTLQLRDLTGKLLMERVSENFNAIERLDLSSFDDGMYVLSISQNNQLKTVKIIKSE